MTDPADWKPLTPAFMAALRRYDQAADARLRRVQRRDTITAPLYHYTDRAALSGIITNSEIWFTHYQHLNDDREIKFGLEIAKAILAESGARWRKAKVFCDLVADLFSLENVDDTLDFFIASFSRSRDHVRQRGVIWLWDKVALDHSAAVAIWGGIISTVGGASSAIASVCM